MTRVANFIKFQMTDGSDIEIGKGDQATTGTAVGYSFCPSWGMHGYAGGVAQRQHMVQMAEWVLFETKHKDSGINFHVQGAGQCDITYMGSEYKVMISWARTGWDILNKAIAEEEMARMATHVMKTSEPIKYREMRLGEIGI